MFGSECVPAGLFTLLILLVPETPRYLAMSGQEDKALTVLSNINGESKAREILNDIKNTVVEKKEKLLAYGFLVIFIGIMLSVFQQFVGINAVLYFAPRIFESMGMGNPMTQTVLMGVINITFTLVAIFTVEKARPQAAPHRRVPWAWPSAPWAWPSRTRCPACPASSA
jgi:Sugar (and other) transporter.